MPVTFPHLRVGNPVRHEALALFPLYTDSQGEVDYCLSNEALADQFILIEEVSNTGSVPELMVENKSDRRVLFLEGEELIGAKQNRVLNTSVLIPAHARIKIPVSCVEQGRWRYKSRYFGSSLSHSPTKLRRALKKSVSLSLLNKLGHRSDQGEVWNEVASLHAKHGVVSGTGAMSDAFETYQEKISTFKDKLKYVDGATGVAVAIGGVVVSLDLFDKSSTCQKVWDRLISGVVFDALEARESTKTITTSEVEQILSTASNMSWERATAIGEGDEYRAKSAQGDHASALVYQDTLVHGSLLTGV